MIARRWPTTAMRSNMAFQTAVLTGSRSRPSHAEIAARLTELHRSSGRIHYDDLAYYMWLLLDRSRILRRLWRHKYPVIVLDEYQGQLAAAGRDHRPSHRARLASVRVRRSAATDLRVARCFQAAAGRAPRKPRTLRAHSAHAAPLPALSGATGVDAAGARCAARPKFPL